jgi:hypothetical protein
MNGRHRQVLWVLLSVLTIGLFIYPARLTNEFQPVESLYVFQNLPFFAVIFITWFTVLLILVLTCGNNRTENLEKMILVAIFTLVFSGIWVSLRGAYSGEASREASNIAYLNLHGNIPVVGNIYRTDFPGVAIFGSILSQVSSLSDFNVIIIMNILYIIMFPVIVYLILLDIITDSRWAAIGVLLTIIGSIMFDKGLFQFHPSSFSIFLLFTPLVYVFLSDQHRPAFKNSGIVIVILLMALTMSHLVTSTTFVFVLVGTSALQRFSGTNLVTVSKVAITVVVILSWELYRATNTFGGMVTLIPKMMDDLREGQFFSGYIVGLFNSYTTSLNPVWANLIRYFWLGILLVFPSVLVLVKILHFRQFSDKETKLIGGMIGIAIILLITIFVAGGDALYRVLMYAPLFCIPIVGLYCSKIHIIVRPYLLGFFAVILLLLVFPTFLAHNNTVSTSAYYSYEFSNYRWLKTQYGEAYLSFAGGWHPIDYYFESPHGIDFGTTFEFLSSKDVSGLLEERFQRIERLKQASFQSSAIYIFEDSRETFEFQHLLGVSPNSYSKWKEFLLQLQLQDKIYENNYIQVYNIHGIR